MNDEDRIWNSDEDKCTDYISLVISLCCSNEPGYGFKNIYILPIGQLALKTADMNSPRNSSQRSVTFWKHWELLTFSKGV